MVIKPSRSYRIGQPHLPQGHSRVFFLKIAQTFRGFFLATPSGMLGTTGAFLSSPLAFHPGDSKEGHPENDRPQIRKTHATAESKNRCPSFG